MGASRIFAVDVNPDKFAAASAFGATDCVNSLALPPGATIVSHLVSLTTWGVDFTFDCTGNVDVMRRSLSSRPYLFNSHALHLCVPLNCPLVCFSPRAFLLFSCVEYPEYPVALPNPMLGSDAYQYFCRPLLLFS